MYYNTFFQQMVKLWLFTKKLIFMNKKDCESVPMKNI